MKRYSGDLLAILGKKRKEAAALRNNAEQQKLLWDSGSGRTGHENEDFRPYNAA